MHTAANSVGQRAWLCGRGLAARALQAGFTLLELLVVIAMISLLAAMLLPALNRAKVAARSTRCKSNLRQMEVALQLYVDDNRGKYPYDYVVWVAYSAWWWVDAIGPYYPLNWTNAAYHCPGYKGIICNSVPWFNNGLPPFYVGSYGYNAFGTGGIWEWEKLLGLGPLWGDAAQERTPPVTESMVFAPSEMIALADTEMYGTEDPLKYRGGLTDLLPSPEQLPGHALDPRLYPLRHGKNYNFVCCDGHVEAMPPALLFSPWANAARWNNDHRPHPETWPARQ